jgi:hypothetical protein
MEPLVTPLLLAATGIDVPDHEVAPLLDYMNELLEERIGEAVVEMLDDAQLEELAALQETANETEVAAWVQAHTPTLSEIVQDQLALILGEAAKHRTEFSSQ